MDLCYLRRSDLRLCKDKKRTDRSSIHVYIVFLDCIVVVFVVGMNICDVDVTFSKRGTTFGRLCWSHVLYMYHTCTTPIVLSAMKMGSYCFLFYCARKICYLPKMLFKLFTAEMTKIHVRCISQRFNFHIVVKIVYGSMYIPV